MTALGLLPLVVALAQAPPAAQPPQAPEPAAGLPAQPAGAAGKGYRVGAGDILQVAVYGHDDLTQTVIVQEGGSFPFPLLGSVAAAGATTEELEARIAKSLAKGFLRDAKVSVRVREYRSQVVYVVGELARPGTYPLAGVTRIVEILSRAGPLAPQAAGEVLIVRPAAPAGGPVLPGEAGRPQPAAAGGAGAGQARVLRVDLRALQVGRLDQNLVLEAGDTVFVPRAEQIFVTGEVRNPGAFAYSEGLTARQAIALAGGFTQDAATGAARLVRGQGGQQRTLKIGLDERLRPGDTIVIKAAWF